MNKKNQVPQNKTIEVNITFFKSKQTQALTNTNQNAIVKYLQNHHAPVTILLQKLGEYQDKVLEVKFQRLDQGLYQMDKSDSQITFFHTSENIRQTLFDASQSPKGFLLGFDLQGRRTAFQFLPGTSSATFILGMHQPFVLFVPESVLSFPDFNFFMLFDGELIISGSEKLKVVKNTHVFRVKQLEQLFGSIKNISDKFNLRLVSNNELATLHSMGDHLQDFHEFYAVLDALGLKLGVDYFFCYDEFPESGKRPELSTLISHPWIGSELNDEGSFVWMR